MHEDDMICVLLRAKVPALLRPSRWIEGWEFIGPVYVYGIMHREALKHKEAEIKGYVLI